MTYDIDEGAGLVRMVGGDTTLPEWQRLMSAIFDDPRYRPGMSFLLDRREATALVSEVLLRAGLAFLEAHRQYMAGGQWALVVPERPAEVGVMRQAAVRATRAGIRMRVFTEPEQALLWLGATELSGSAPR